jgi:hypothetical protein
VKTLLESAALVLSLVNGLFLLLFYLRDRPRLRVSAIHPEAYQWWFRLPDSERDGVPTRRFGFLLYISATNSGLRPTTLDRWRLRIRASNGHRADLVALSIPEPSVEFAGNLKVYQVLGARGLIHDGDTRLEPGGSISGMAFYEYECYGDHTWDPQTHDGAMPVRLRVREVFGHRASCRIVCREKSLQEMERLVPTISSISQDACSEQARQPDAPEASAIR